MARKPPRQNSIRDFVKEAHKLGREPVIVTTTLPDGTVRTEMRASTSRQSDQEAKGDNEWDNE